MHDLRARERLYGELNQLLGIFEGKFPVLLRAPRPNSDVLDFLVLDAPCNFEEAAKDA